MESFGYWVLLVFACIVVAVFYRPFVEACSDEDALNEAYKWVDEAVYEWNSGPELHRSGTGASLDKAVALADRAVAPVAFLPFVSGEWVVFHRANSLYPIDARSVIRSYIAWRAGH